MIKRTLQIICLLLASTAPVMTQDTIRVNDFDFSKFRPAVQFFANAEYNPSAGVTKDYSFWIGRAQFGFDYQYNDKWSAKILVDRTSAAGLINSMYLKQASLQWKPNDRWTLVGGAIVSNSFYTQEKFWNYRFVAETFQDRYYCVPSTDLGFGVTYTFGPRLSIDAAVTNGEGPKIDQDNFGKVKAAGGITFIPVKGLILRAYLHDKGSGAEGSVHEKLLMLFAGYEKENRFRIGGEFNQAEGYQNDAGRSSYGASVYGWITLRGSLKYLARYDRLWINAAEGQTTAGETDFNALITGFSICPVKNVTFCLNYQGVFHADRETKPGHRVLFSFEYRL